VRDHAAILLPRYIDLILEGKKTVESRLSIVRPRMFGLVRPGDRIWLKQVGGPFRAVALALHVEQWSNLTPTDLAALRAAHGRAIAAPAAYWKRHARARYAVFIWLCEIRTPTQTPTINCPKGSRHAWYVLTPNARVVTDTPPQNDP
jgi:hypothetical protein